MHNVVPEIEKVCSTLIQKKVTFLIFTPIYLFIYFNQLLWTSASVTFILLWLVQLIYSKYDEVGVILFGTQGLNWAPPL